MNQDYSASIHRPVNWGVDPLGFPLILRLNSLMNRRRCAMDSGETLSRPPRAAICGGAIASSGNQPVVAQSI